MKINESKNIINNKLLLNKKIIEKMMVNDEAIPKNLSTKKEDIKLSKGIFLSFIKKYLIISPEPASVVIFNTNEIKL